MESLLRISDAASLGIHAMTYVACLPTGRWVSANEIADAFDVSRAHLSKVLLRLQRAGLLESKRGPGGGFALSRAARDITLLQVFEAVEGPLGDATCLLSKTDPPHGGCLLDDLINSIYASVRDHLRTMSLDVASRKECIRRFLPAELR